MPSHLQPEPGSPRRAVVLGSRGFAGRERIFRRRRAVSVGVARQEFDPASRSSGTPGGDSEPGDAIGGGGADPAQRGASRPW
jgi:hypothetical protein